MQQRTQALLIRLLTFVISSGAYTCTHLEARTHVQALDSTQALLRRSLRVSVVCSKLVLMQARAQAHESAQALAQREAEANESREAAAMAESEADAAEAAATAPLHSDHASLTASVTSLQQQVRPF